ncbi:CapA family protein [Micromonospora lupini]|uniref:CapA family protein n=1 Tax=Micromonospora lupini TaxID=285679 RepID=UPI0033E98E27
MAISLFAVGDVFIDRGDPQGAFRASGEFLRTGDVVFGNCEGVFSDDWDRAPTSGPPVVAPNVNAQRLAEAGFHVLSMANNHIVDGGHRAMLSSRTALNGLGIRTAGAGPTYREAHAPAIVERDGIRVAFLAYSSVFPRGYEARGLVPGLAAVRAHTHYVAPDPNYWDPGVQPQIRTETLPEDADALVRDVEAARRDADIVAVSVHWGDMFRAFVVGAHERRIARLAIDAGADLVLGHHQHMLRGVDFYRGRPIFYGLGHYVFDLPDLPRRMAEDGVDLPRVRPEDDLTLHRYRDTYDLGPREGYPLLPFHPDGRLTGVAVVRVDRSGITAVGFCPAVINADNDPIQVAADSEDGKRVLDYLQEACTSEKLPVRFVRPTLDAGLPVGSVQILPSGAPV